MIDSTTTTGAAAGSAASNAILPETFVWLCLGLVLLATHGHEMTAWSALALFSRRSFHLFPPTNNNDNDESTGRRRGSSWNTSSASSQLKKQQQQSNKLWRFSGEQGLAIFALDCAFGYQIVPVPGDREFINQSVADFGQLRKFDDHVARDKGVFFRIGS